MYTGGIEVICGSMFSGKSEELIRRLKRAEYGRLNVQAFKPEIDNRYSKESVVSHNGSSMSAIPVKSATEIMGLIKRDTHLVGIDEAQFFDCDIVSVVEQLADQGLKVIIAGLDQDFRGEPFGRMPELMAHAETVTKLQAICPCCGAPASRTQRLINDVPASYNEPVILVGASESYEPRCRHCHEVPNKPQQQKMDQVIL